MKGRPTLAVAGAVRLIGNVVPLPGAGASSSWSPGLSLRSQRPAEANVPLTQMPQ